MELTHDRYVVYERDATGQLVPVLNALVLTPDTPFVTMALMAMSRGWSGPDAAVAKELRELAADWAPPVQDLAFG